MKKKRRRKGLEYFGADKLVVFTSDQNQGAPTNVEWLAGQNFARDLNKEIISYCEKHFRYGG
jgi:hypothetical protein